MYHLIYKSIHYNVQSQGRGAFPLMTMVGSEQIAPSEARDYQTYYKVTKNRKICVDFNRKSLSFVRNIVRVVLLIIRFTMFCKTGAPMPRTPIPTNYGKKFCSQWDLILSPRYPAKKTSLFVEVDILH